jgi:hypothetical protein
VESKTGSNRRTLWVVIAAVAAMALISAPVVQAATQEVEVKGTVKVKVQGTVSTKIKDTSGGQINSDPTAGANPGVLGILGAEGSDGALDVSTFGGGGGLLANGDCSTDDTQLDPPNQIVSNTDTVAVGSVITAIIITPGPQTLAAPGATFGADGRVTVTVPDLQPGFDFMNFTVNAADPNLFVGLGNGLTVDPNEMVFTGLSESGAATGKCRWVVLGQ